MIQALPIIRGVVVTYNPGGEVIANISALAKQLSSVVVVDNGSHPDCAEVLQNIERLGGVELVRNERNLGIAAALNVGIKRNLAIGCQWIATFDQDSTVGSDYFAELLRALENFRDREAVGLLAPNHLFDEQQATSSATNHESTVRTAVITSGSVIRADAFGLIGFYDERLFIDYVDFDFCLRLKEFGLKVLQAEKVWLKHRLGTPESHRLFGIRITIKSHRPWRRYYIMRNRILMYRRYVLSSPGWVIVDFGWLFLDLAKILLFEDSKMAKLRNVAKGIAHGLLGRTGMMVVPS